MAINNIDADHKDFSRLATAAIAIETMMEFCSAFDGEEPTIH